jgi:1-acyl-sn-glycerol-3-phosphate acyltransferase
MGGPDRAFGATTHPASFARGSLRAPRKFAALATIPRVPSALETLVRTAACTALLPPLLIAHSAEAGLFALLGASRSRVQRAYDRFASLCLAAGGTELHVHGLDHVKPDQPYVIVANHESNWDPVALVAALRGRYVRFVVKKEITRIPIFGHALLATGNVMVERANTAADVARIRRGMEARPLDVSILFYPEGTRSRDGALHEFKKGAFSSALAYGLPILPIGHAGSYHVWTPNTLRIRRNPVAVEIGAPIEVGDLTLADRDPLRDRARDVVAELRTRARRRVRQLGGETGGIDG